MSIFDKCNHQTPSCPHDWYWREELANGITHLIGTLLGIVALVLLIVMSSLHGSAINIVACTIFGVSLIIAYGASSLYHFVTSWRVKFSLRKLDHIGIYLLIAGSYTPFTLVALRGPWGWSLFGVVWGLAVIGIIVKIFAAHRYEWVSTISYIGMGWLALIAVVPIFKALPDGGLIWLILGGLLYTAGVLFFLLETIAYAHTIWHLFVLAGSVCHFFAVFWYVAPMLVVSS